jgi:hypothetical protein
LANNTVSGLRRGTAGTAAAGHRAGDIVYDIVTGNLLPDEYQDRIVSDSMFGDQSTTTFTAPSITILPSQADSVEVYVGGVRQYPVNDDSSIDLQSEYPWSLLHTDPVTVDFEELIPSNLEITILVRQALIWYQQGPDASVSTVEIGKTYFIRELGNTDWLAIGAPVAQIGVLFEATAVGTGTGRIKTASDGRPLQETDTLAARFLRGL